MNLIFLSNFYNHHQGPLCRALATQDGVSFRFLGQWIDLTGAARNVG